LPVQPIATARRFFAPLAFAGSLDARALDACRADMEAGAADAGFARWKKSQPR
jgi:hypothetical protein